MAVADVFTAITEDRPYRKGMPLDEALRLLRSMGGPHLDPDVVDTLVEHADAINAERLQAQAESRRFSEALHRACGNPDQVRTEDRLSLL